MMKRLLPALAVVASLFTVPAKADNYTATPGAGLTFGAKLIGGVLYPWFIPLNSSGQELFTSGNPAFVNPGSISNWGLMSGTSPGAAPANTAIIGAIYNVSPPSPSTGQTLPLQTDSAGNLLVNVKTGGGSTASGPTKIAQTPTVIASAYSGGNCIGGFNSVAVVTNNGQAGLLMDFRVSSSTGSTPSLTVYVFDSNPTSSTCTDQGTFTLNAADIDKLIFPPQTITLTSPFGSTPSMSELSMVPPHPFIAGGSLASGVKTIYYGLVTTAFTPASTTDLHVNIGLVQN
jgi:hypothetical protein